MYLVNPYLILIGLIFAAAWALNRRSYLGYSDLSLLGASENKNRFSFMWAASKLPVVVSLVAIALLLVALARPQKREEKLYQQVQGKDIILIMDLSWSMNNSVEIGTRVKKIDLARKAALEFVNRRHGDRVGLLLFGDETYGAWPLTTDLTIVQKRIQKIGGQFLGGTNFEKPLLQAFKHFQDMGSNAGKVIIFVTDGIAPVDGAAKAEIVAQLKRLGAKLYLLGIKLTDADDILDIVKRSGGNYMDIQNDAQFDNKFDEINRIESATIKVEHEVLYKDIFSLFVVAALSLLLARLSLENTLFIRVP